MSFTGSVTGGDHVILIRGDKVVDACSIRDRDFGYGESSLFEVQVARGLPVEGATININHWDVYRGDDPEVVHVLLERIYQLEQELEDPK